MERYDSYKDSGVEWIGEIPSQWKHTKMKYVGTYINGYPFKPSDWGDNGRLIIRIQNLTKGKGSENFYDNEIDPKYIIKKGDYLFSWSTTLGLFEWKREEGVLNQHIFKVELNEILVRRFYYWVIQGVIEELSNESHGSTMTHLTKDVFGDIKLPFPPISEQQQIVSFLDTKTSLIDSLIEKTQRKIELLKEKRTSLINEVVTKGLNPNVEIKDSGVEWIGEIPSHWNLSLVGRHFEIGRGRVISKVEIGDNKGDYPVYSSQTSNNGELGRINTYDFDGEYVTWTTDGANTGTCFFRSGKFNTTNVCGMLSLRNTPYSLPFLSYYLNQVTKPYVRIDINPKLMNNMMSEIPLVIPPLPEQQQIVEYLDKQTQLIDKTISIEEKRIELLKEYRQSLISEVVTGKRKVV